MNIKLWRHSWLPLLIVLVSFMGCVRPDPLPPYRLNELIKSQRELLGKRLEIALLTQPESFPIRSGLGESNETLYKYLQSYYNQASFLYRLDRDALPEERWDPNRLWRVRVLENAEVKAFCLPAGDFYISTGLLQILNNESELYALMCFEASLVQEKIILENLSSQFEANNFIDLLELGYNSAGESSFNLLETFFQLQYEDSQITSLDKITQTHICNSSAFDKNSLAWLVENIESNSSGDWLSRKSYPGRINSLLNFSDRPSCGSRVTDGSYQQQVLDNL